MGIERLQLLVRCCNISGLLPFRRVLNEDAKMFRRFECHWRHPANWWFILLLICHFLVTAIHIYLSWIYLTRDDSEILTTVDFTVLILLYGNFAVIFSFPRFFLFHIRHLETAFDILH